MATPFENGTKNHGDTEKHATTNRPYYRVFDTDLDPVKIVDEELSVLRLKSLLLDIEDGVVQHNIQIQLNSSRMVIATSTEAITLLDRKTDMGDPHSDPPVAADPDKVTNLGLTNAVAGGQVTLRTHEGHMQYGGYVREELIFGDLTP